MSNPSDPSPSNGFNNRFASSDPRDGNQNGGQLRYERPKLLKTMSNPGKLVGFFGSFLNNTLKIY